MDNLLVFTGTTAKEYAKEAKLEEWVHQFLCNEGNNIPFSEGLRMDKRVYHGPYKMPINLFIRICGPEENMQYRIDEGGFEWRVAMIKKRIEQGWDVPPLIVNFSDNEFELNDGNHRYQAMIDSCIKECEVIIWTTGAEDQQRFLEVYDNL